MRPHWPAALWIGAALLLACHLLLFLDVHWSGRGAPRTQAEVVEILSQRPQDALPRLARFVAVNMTPLVWVSYLVFLEGILAAQGRRGGQPGSPVRRRPNHFFLLALASVIIWCLFDLINFYSIGAWKYLGVPPAFFSRFWAYFLAFAAIVPGMLMTGQVLLNAGLLNFARTRPWRMPEWAIWLIFFLGCAMFVWPIVHPDPVTNLTLWISLIFILDPLNLKLGRPSMLDDWQAGWYGRTLAAFTGGLACGLLWEFWNFWALAKWTYDLPFLGPLEQVRYFEMPVLGLLGFIPFGMQCWVMWQTMRIPLDGLVEPLADERSLL